MVDEPARPEVSQSASTVPDRTARLRSKPRRGEPISPWRLLATHNPLYAVSAALVFYGLRVSFQVEAALDAWVLLVALSAYVALLTATAIGLRRLGALWEDMRMLALLVLLLLVGVSVTFDRTVVTAPPVGWICFAVGWVLAAATCELLLHGLRVRLPLGYRLPFHALLALFFVYPPFVAWTAGWASEQRVAWLLAGFTPLASALLLTLLPALLRGGAYVNDNGTPWRWPWYPLTLFAFLGTATIGRAYCLCYSLHFVPDGETIFGPYFAAPLIFVVGALMLIAGRRETTRVAALAAPAICVLLASLRPDGDPTFNRFADEALVNVLGGGPLAIALCVGILFYAGAMLRRVPGSAECLFGALVSSSIYYGPATTLFDGQAPIAPPLAAAALLAAVVTFQRRQVGWGWAFTAAFTAAVAAATAVAMREATVVTATQAGYHAALVAAAAVGFSLRDRRGAALRALAVGMLLIAYTKALVGGDGGLFGTLPPLTKYYPPTVIVILATCAIVRRDRASGVLLGVTVLEWLGIEGLPAYRRWRDQIVGLDAIVAGMAAFIAAVLVSIAHSEWWTRLSLRRAERQDPSVAVEADDGA